MPFDDQLYQDITAESAEDELARLKLNERISAAPVPTAAPEMKLPTPIKKKKSGDPNESEYERTYKRLNDKLLGLDQKYDENGNPRKKTVGEKFGAAGKIAMGLFGGTNVRGELDARTKSVLETGEKERVAEINAQQRREAAAEKAANDKLKIENDAAYRKDKLDADKDLREGKIDLLTWQARVSQANAERINGVTRGTSVEGKDVSRLKNSQAGLNDARAANTVTPDERRNKSSMDARLKMAVAQIAGGNRNLGSESQQLSDPTGQNVTTRRTVIRGQQPDISQLLQGVLGAGQAPGAPGGQGQIPVAQPGKPVTREEALSVPQQGALGLPDPAAVATVPPASSFAPPKAVEMAQAGLGKQRGSNLTFAVQAPPVADKKYQELVRSKNTMLREAQSTANQALNAWVKGDLDKYSGLQGTPLIEGFLNVIGRDPETAISKSVGDRLQTKLFANSEQSDFGNRAMNIMLKAEGSSFPKAWYAATQKVAALTGQMYARAISTWAENGSPEQKQIAEEIIRDPNRRGALEESASAYLGRLGQMKGSSQKGNIPPMSENIFILSRTDEELRKLFPQANTPEKLRTVRALGGELGKGLPSTPATAAAPNDNAKTKYR